MKLEIMGPDPDLARVRAFTRIPASGTEFTDQLDFLLWDRREPGSKPRPLPQRTSNHSAGSVSMP